MIKLSIVIPVYNVEKYLSECLDSICKQDFENLQVICINDCSTDNSYKILQQYKNQYDYIEVYQNTRNKGLSYTRNRGMKNAIGKYIMFVDADDYIAPNILNELYDNIKDEGADILLFDVQEVGSNVNNGGRRIRKNKYEKATGVQLFSEFVKHNEMFSGAWSGIYKREFLEQKGLHFIEGILHEDIPYMFAVLLKAQWAVYFSKVVYYYRQRENSILHKPDYEKLALGLLIGYADMLTTWQQFKTQNEDLAEYNTYVKKYMKSVVRLLSSRCDLWIKKKQKTNECILQFFLENFEINVKSDIEDYFSLDDIEEMRQRGYISIYGAGETAYNIIPLLIASGVQIDKVYVTDTNKNKDSIFGIHIEQFGQLPFQDDKHFIAIAAMNNNKEEIIKILNQNGYQGHILTI